VQYRDGFDGERLNMNWKLILTLSLFGLAMAILSLFGLGIFEFLLWLAIFVLYAVIIARRAPGKYFLHGFGERRKQYFGSAIHATFFSMYVKNNPQMAQGTPPGMNPRIMMIVAGPVVGAVMGVVAGLFAFIASKIFKTSG